MKKTILFAVFLFGLVSSGCFKINYARQVGMQAAPAYDEWHHIGIFALVEFSDPVQLGYICPTGFARVHHEVSFINGLVPLALGVVGLSWVYTPSTITVWCESGLGYELGMTRDGMVASARRFQ